MKRTTLATILALLLCTQALAGDIPSGDVFSQPPPNTEAPLNCAGPTQANNLCSEPVSGLPGIVEMIAMTIVQLGRPLS